jgi:hypothetical protein
MITKYKCAIENPRETREPKKFGIPFSIKG